ncbi:MAG: MoxR family ATPase [Pseudomonadota bacterium]
MTDDDTDLNQIEATIAKVGALREQLSQCVMGQEAVISQVIICLLAGGHALIEGVPGLGKTLLVRALAEAIGGQFSRVQFTPDLMPSDVTGHTMFDMKDQTWSVRRGPVFCNLLLADEINRAPAKTQSALLEVMGEQQVTIEGDTLSVEQPFTVFATQNPVEQEGTYPLPEAQLDRFLMKIRIDYPTVEEEKAIAQQIVGQVGDKLDVTGVEQVMETKTVIGMQQTTAALTIDEQVLDYAVRIVAATRSWSGVEMGASPRGSLALIRTARASALLNGNHFVTPDDVKDVAPAVLRHRLTLTPDYEIEGYSVDRVIEDLLNNVDAPRL